MPRHRIGLLFLIFAVSGMLAASGGRAAAADLQPIVTTDLLRLRTITHIDVSADGSKAVFTVISIAAKPGSQGDDEPAEYEYRSHIYLLDLNDREAQPRQMTHGSRNDRSPRFAPNGRAIAFVRGAEDGEGQGGQIWVMPTDGGEARQVTRLEHGAGSPQWSPDGRYLLVESNIPFSEIDGRPEWPTERPRRNWAQEEAAAEGDPRPDGTRDQIRAWLHRNAGEHNPSVITRLDFQEEQRLKREKRFRHLFLVDTRDELAEPRRLTTGFHDHRDARFMPEGRRIVYVSKKPTEIHPDRVERTVLRMVRVDGSEDRVLLAKDSWRLASPWPSRDGTMIAFRGQRLDEPAFRQWKVGIASITQGEATETVWLTDRETFDYSVRTIRWRHDRAGLYFTAAWRGGIPVMSISPGVLEPTEVISSRGQHPVGVYQFAHGAGRMVYTETSPANPCVLRVRDARGDRLAWDPNPWIARRAISTPREGWITRPDGTQVHYWLMEPANREPGQTYPLVLQIHGGPSAMWGPGEMTMWHEFQLLCSWGYGVVYANPRGSGGYGYEFQRANYQNWGDGPAGDVLAAVDQAILEDWVDRDRLVITGGSYAGYLTAWIVAHDHRFRAAVAQRGVYHLATFFGEGNAWRLVERAMGGHPFEARTRQIIERESPFSYVHRIRTPLLIMHASEDLRTGVSQSEMMYRALKVLERPVEYVRYPGAGHDLSRSGDPRQRMDRLNRIVEFFERHIDNPRPAPTQTESE